MAQSINISRTKENTVKIVIDGNEIHDVISCELQENADLPILTIKLSVVKNVQVQQ